MRPHGLTYLFSTVCLSYFIRHLITITLLILLSQENLEHIFKTSHGEFDRDRKLPCRGGPRLPDIATLHEMVTNKSG